MSSKAKWYIFGGIIVTVTLGVVVYIIYLLLNSDEVKLNGIFKTWATALDEPQCAHVSKEIYAIGGTVADATVASMLCLGVVLPESLGIGGGFFAIYFSK